MPLTQPTRQTQPPQQAVGKRLLPADPYVRNSRCCPTLFEASLHDRSRAGTKFLSEDFQDA